MTDMTAFERQLSGEISGLMGPVRPVDDAAIFSAITATQSPKWRFSSMFSAAKFVLAGAIVALFGAILLQGILQTPQDEDSAPAAVTGSPSPTAIEGSTFPTGTFVAEDEDLTLEFRADGTCERAGTPCTYGVLGVIFSEMTFEDPSGPQVPATYLWRFDGEQLTFEPRDHDPRPGRRDTYLDHVYRPVGEVRPLPPTETGFPKGRFVSTDDDTVSLVILDNGHRDGSDGGDRFIVNGNRYTSTNVGADLRIAPATYYWEWDGDRLTFRPWGEDDDSFRTALLDHEFIRDAAAPPPRRLLLGDPRLEGFVTVEIQELPDGRYSVTATSDEDPLGEGVGDTPPAAGKAALEGRGDPLASDIAEKVPG